MERRNCTECDGNLVYQHDADEYMCEQCGLVSENYSRMMPIRNSDNDNGNDKKVHVDRKMKRLMQIDNQNDDYYKEDSIKNAEIGIKRTCELLKIPEHICNDAVLLYGDMYQEHTQGILNEVAIAGTIYYTCRMNKMPVTLDELSIYFGIHVRQISNLYNKLRKKHKNKPPILLPSDYVKRLCSKLELSVQTMIESEKLCKQIQGVMSGNKPIAIASAVIYHVSNDNGKEISKSELSKETNVSWPIISDKCEKVGELLAELS